MLGLFTRMISAIYCHQYICHRKWVQTVFQKFVTSRLTEKLRGELGGDDG